MTARPSVKDMFSGEQLASLIEEVKTRPVLWDYTNKDYKNARKLLENWKSIAEILSYNDRSVSGMFIS
jgi:ribosomal protein S15P/S13E